MGTEFQLRSYAKINLYLDVLDRRDDGFHNILTVFQTLDLHDTLAFTSDATHLSLDSDAPDLKTDESNLIIKAARLLQSHAGCTSGASIRLEKRIPVAAGLAGGSGNAAATLVGLNRLWDLHLDEPTLETLAAQLGSDVPYCLRGGSMMAMGRGEELSPISLTDNLHILLAPQPISISTPWVYNHPDLPRAETSAQAEAKSARFSNAIAEFAKGNFEGHVYNAMEAVVFEEHPELVEVKQSLIDTGAVAAAMSGSGPTMFGIYPSRALAEEALPHFQSGMILDSVEYGIRQED